MARAKRVVLVEGIEPTRPCGHRILSPARLPVPPHQLRWVAYHGGWGGLKGGSIKLLGRAERFYRRDAEGAEKVQGGQDWPAPQNRLGVGFCFCVEFGGLDDGAEDAAPADDVFAGAGDGFEDEEAAFVSGQARVGPDVGADGGGFQVV